MSIELTYTKVGDYYIPDLTLTGHDQRALGKYGQMRKVPLSASSGTLKSDDLARKLFC